MIKRADIVASARKFVGTPFIHQGRDPVRGLDCVGLIWAVGKDLGYDFTLITGYLPSPSGQKVAEEAAKVLVKAPVQGWDAAKPGDIILIDGWQKGVPQHLAIIGSYSSYRTMIHATSVTMKAVEHRIMPSWAAKYHSTWTYPGTEP